MIGMWMIMLALTVWAWILTIPGAFAIAAICSLIVRAFA